jgi:GTP cyclohydrolase IB
MEIKTLPDVASQTEVKKTKTEAFAGFSSLNWVGMNKIQMPVLWKGKTLSASITAQVNLIAGKSRGIHMSRLYNLLTKSFKAEEISWNLLEKIALAFIESQGELSQKARLIVSLDIPLERKALKSDLSGWRLYPVELEIIATAINGILGQESSFQRLMSVEILYSSTCPASTALSLELWRQEIKKQESHGLGDWIESLEVMPGTPHAQRSKANVQVKISQGNLSPEDLIEGLEHALQTPVQTAVKREDEQEFARLNGQNTMFCEDAARRIQEWLNSLINVTGYKGTFEHQESLHPHNAVAFI